MPPERRNPLPCLVIPTEGRNLLVAGSVALQTDSRFLNGSTPFRNDNKVNSSKSRDASFRPKEETRFHALSFRPEGGICWWLAAWHCKRTADSSTAQRRFGMTMK
jgi:hypothetical protein